MSTRQDKRSTAWLRHRNLVIDLAINQDRSYPAVAEYLRLNTELKDANERKVRLHIKAWKVQKKLNEDKVAAALKVLMDSGQPWDEANTFFRFGNNPEKFSLRRLLSYLRRKKVTDVVAWLASRQGGASSSSEEPPTVELLPRVLPKLPGARDSVGALISAQSFGNRTVLVPDESWEPPGLPSPWWQTMYDGIGLPRAPTPIPDYCITEQVLAHAAHYTRVYLQCPRQGSEKEPSVHMNTTHGRFGAAMQEGIFLSTHNAEAAVVSFRSGFVMLEDILKTEHPMRIAQVFAIVSEMLARSSPAAPYSPAGRARPQLSLLQDVSEQLLAHLVALARIYLGHSHPLTEIFSIILAASPRTSPTHHNPNPSRAHLVVTALKRMKDAFETTTPTPTSPCPGHGHGPHDWRALYLTERYADSLYHSQLSPGERHAVRARLLREQTAHYGPGRTNVLWTLTNVADDLLEARRPAEAEGMFRRALRCADEYLGGYARAKMRYAAFEGLAKVVLLRLEMGMGERQRGRGGEGDEMGRSWRAKQLQVADGFLGMAEEEAGAWFPGTRRAEKMRRWRKGLGEEIGGLTGS